MAIDYRSELRRPVPFSLAVIAVVLLVWLIVASLASARQRSVQDHRVEELQTQQTALRGDLDRQRTATGTLAALQARIAAAETQEKQATAAREQAKAKVASLAAEQQAAETKTSESKAASETETKRLGDLQDKVSQAEQKLAPMRDAITAAEQAATARTKELADVGRRLEESNRRGGPTFRFDGGRGRFGSRVGTRGVSRWLMSGLKSGRRVTPTGASS